MVLEGMSYRRGSALHQSSVHEISHCRDQGRMGICGFRPYSARARFTDDSWFINDPY